MFNSVQKHVTQVIPSDWIMNVFFFMALENIILYIYLLQVFCVCVCVQLLV